MTLMEGFTVTAPPLLETWLAINTTLINESCGLFSLENDSSFTLFFFSGLLVTAGMDSDAAITKSFTAVAGRRGKGRKCLPFFPHVDKMWHKSSEKASSC